MSKKRILIIDDERGFSRMLQLHLESSTYNYEVRIENDSRCAVSAALQFQPDLVLLDLIMPYLEGHEVAELFKKNSHLNKTPIVFLTATMINSLNPPLPSSIASYPFIIKPSKIETIVETINKYIPS